MQKTIDKINKNLMKHKVITMLDRNEVEFLDKLGKDSLFSTGHKLSYNEILRALIDFAMEEKVSGENIDTPDALKAKIKEKS
ncbi:MAG: hypothetical protein PHY94_06635 [Candidatus Omnitrophica bacterium]|nr:hypothetical protein [Candidatus Omnitrophota bacterium]